MRRLGLIAAVAGAVSLGTVAATADDIPFPDQRPDCMAHDNFKVGDFSVTLSDDYLEAVKGLKLGVVFRYYDQEDETQRGKTLLPAESDRIIAAGLKIGVVFQHYNDDPTKFLLPGVGTKDAERALMLADANRQPYGSAIYFGIDGPELHLLPLINEYRLAGGGPMSDARKDELRSQHKARLIGSYADFLGYGPTAFHTASLDRVTPSMMSPMIAEYFREIRAVFNKYAAAHRGKAYRIGMYCTPMMCLFGQQRKLADYFWLSPEGRNDPSYRKVVDGGRWNLLQQLTTTCPGFALDFDYVNPGNAAIGQWSVKRTEGR